MAARVGRRRARGRRRAPDLRAAPGPGRLVAGGLVLLAIALGVLWLVPTDYYIDLPDPAHPVAPILHVQGGKPNAGDAGIYFVDVIQKRASLIERWWPGIRSGSSLEPVPEGVTDASSAREARAQMRESQRVAPAVALQAAGYPNLIRLTGVLVRGVDPGLPVARTLRAGDVITAVDGTPVRRVCGPGNLGERLQRAGRTARITFRRGGRVRTAAVRTVRFGGRVLLGIFSPYSLGTIGRLPRRVTIEAGRVGGPSAGLAYALEVVDQLGRDLDRGRRIAVTGELDAAGCVLPIGGVKQKTIGARKAGADIFLVPAGENATVARRYAAGLRIQPVQTFQQALHALATD